MVSIQENLARVRQGVAAYETAKTTDEEAEDEHERILREHEDAIREHELRMRDHERALDSHRRRRDRDTSHSSMRFRFKDSHGESSRKRKRTTVPKDSYRHDARDDHDTNADRVDAYTAHPLARPPPSPPYLDPFFSTTSTSTSPQPQPQPQEHSHPEAGSNDDAFRASLFDAMADDEGAAYWEGVYSQPIHIYSRPTTTTSTGELEQMDDEAYAAYVKRKMWERKNPELVREIRTRSEREERERKERTEGAGGAKRKRDDGCARNGGGGFMSDVDEALARGAKRKEAKKWQAAWTTYLNKWDRLKSVPANQKLEGKDLARSIPWPVDTGVATMMTREQVESFFANAPLGNGETRLALLKTERFRWHPDKIQHRFGGENVDKETLAMVTSVFQTIDELLISERKKAEKE